MIYEKSYILLFFLSSDLYLNLLLLLIFIPFSYFRMLLHFLYIFRYNRYNFIAFGIDKRREKVCIRLHSFSQ